MLVAAMTDVGAVDEDARAEFHEACVFDCVVLSPEPTRRVTGEASRPEGSARASGSGAASGHAKIYDRAASDLGFYDL